MGREGYRSACSGHRLPQRTLTASPRYHTADHHRKVQGQELLLEICYYDLIFIFAVVRGGTRCLS